MTTEDLEIRSLSIRTASAAEWSAFNAFENAMRAEIIPDDPPIPCEEEAAEWQARPDFLKESAWALWEPGGKRIVAFVAADADYSGDNVHLARFMLEVLPEYRRRGLGRELLKRVPVFARTHERRLLVASTNERVPAGGEFLKRIGAMAGCQAGENQLTLADLDRGLVRRWLEQAESLQAEFSLVLLEAPVPDKYEAGMVALLQELTNDSPHDDLEIQDSTHVATTFRPFETWILAGGRKRWLLLAIHRGDECVAGMSEVCWRPSQPAIIQQRGTGTLRAFRNRGIGRWRKAAMLDKILREKPHARVIRTGNANSNAAMLKINWELGFKPFISQTIWQIETETVEKYLAAHA